MENKDTMQFFENKKIRSVWDAEKEEWFFSIVDVVAVLTESPNPQTYWRVLKKRLKDEGNETVTNCNGLKMTAPDGKKRMTDEWTDRGVKKGREFAILTDEITRAWSGLSTRQYRDFKGLKKENLRDNMSTTELVLNMLAETSTKDISKAEKPETFEENVSVAKAGGGIAGIARKALEERIGKSVITSENAVQLNAVVSDMIESSAGIVEERSEDENNSD